MYLFMYIKRYTIPYYTMHSFNIIPHHPDYCGPYTTPYSLAESGAAPRRVTKSLFTQKTAGSLLMRAGYRSGSGLWVYVFRKILAYTLGCFLFEILLKTTCLSRSS